MPRSSALDTTTEAIDVLKLALEDQQQWGDSASTVSAGASLSHSDGEDDSDAPSGGDATPAMSRGRVVLPDSIREMYRLVHVATGHVGGNASFGPIYGEMTAASMHKLTQLMKESGLNRDSVFIDIGAGLGKPSAHVAFDPGVKLSLGVECEGTRHNLSLVNARRLALWAHKNDPSWLPNLCFVRQNVMLMTTLGPVTHVFLFDVGMPPNVMVHVAQLFHISNVATHIICFRAPASMKKLRFNVELQGSLSVSMHGSSERHTGYVYRKLGDILPEVDSDDDTSSDSEDDLAVPVTGEVDVHDPYMRGVEIMLQLRSYDEFMAYLESELASWIAIDFPDMGKQEAAVMSRVAQAARRVMENRVRGTRLSTAEAYEAAGVQYGGISRKHYNERHYDMELQAALRARAGRPGRPKPSLRHLTREERAEHRDRLARAAAQERAAYEARHPGKPVPRPLRKAPHVPVFGTEAALQFSEDSTRELGIFMALQRALRGPAGFADYLDKHDVPFQDEVYPVRFMMLWQRASESQSAALADAARASLMRELSRADHGDAASPDCPDPGSTPTDSMKATHGLPYLYNGAEYEHVETLELESGLLNEVKEGVPAWGKALTFSDMVETVPGLFTTAVPAVRDILQQLERTRSEAKAALFRHGRRSRARSRGAAAVTRVDDAEEDATIDLPVPQPWITPAPVPSSPSSPVATMIATLRAGFRLMQLMQPVSRLASTRKPRMDNTTEVSICSQTWPAIFALAYRLMKLQMANRWVSLRLSEAVDVVESAGTGLFDTEEGGWDAGACHPLVFAVTVIAGATLRGIMDVLPEAKQLLEVPPSRCSVTALSNMYDAVNWYEVLLLGLTSWQQSMAGVPPDSAASLTWQQLRTTGAGYHASARTTQGTAAIGAATLAYQRVHAAAKRAGAIGWQGHEDKPLLRHETIEVAPCVLQSAQYHEKLAGMKRSRVGR